MCRLIRLMSQISTLDHSICPTLANIRGWYRVGACCSTAHTCDDKLVQRSGSLHAVCTRLHKPRVLGSRHRVHCTWASLSACRGRMLVSIARTTVLLRLGQHSHRRSERRSIGLVHCRGGQRGLSLETTAYMYGMGGREALGIIAGSV